MEANLGLIMQAPSPAYKDSLDYIGGIRYRLQSTTFASRILDPQLHWVSHVTRVSENRLLCGTFFGLVDSTERAVGASNKKGYIRSILKTCNILSDMSTMTLLEPLKRSCSSRQRKDIEYLTGRTLFLFGLPRWSFFYDYRFLNTRLKSP